MSLLDKARSKQGAGSDATPWKPENAGEGVEGTVLSIHHVPSDYQDDVMIPFVTLALDNGDKVSVAGFRTVLRKEIEQEKPAQGDRMAAVYMGTETLKNGKFAGRPVHVYRVVVDKSSGSKSQDKPVKDTPPF